jgi:hypothetical protein
MHEHPDAAHLILAKVLIGQLPRRATTKCSVGHGQGLSCDGCDRPITPADVQHDVDAIGLGTLRFHARCMQLWEEASATPRDISGGSAPSASASVFDLHVARRAARPAGQGQPQVAPASSGLGVRGWRGRATALAGTLWTRCAVRFSRPPVRRPAIGGSYAAVAVALALTVATVWTARPTRDVGTREPSPQERTSALREIPQSHAVRPTPLARGAAANPTAREARSARLAPRTPPPLVGGARVSSRRSPAAPPRVSDARGHVKASTTSAREVVYQAP